MLPSHSYPALGVALVCCLAVGCGDSTSQSSPSERPVQKVTVAVAEQTSVTDFVELVGRLAADKSVNIQSRVSGFLLSTHFEDGQRVKEGDLLFTIEPDEYIAIYNQALAQIDVAQAQLDLAQKTLERSKELLDNNAVSRQEYDQDQATVAEAQAQLKSANADVARVKLDVDYTKILSPVTGRVDRALLDDGNYVTGGLVGGTHLTTVVSDQPIKAVVNIDENVRLRVMRRQREMGGEDFKEANTLADLKIPCYLQLQDEKDFPHEGVLDYVEVKIDQQTGTSQLRGLFPNKDGLLKPGMFVRVKVPVSDPHEAILVRDTAIGTDQATNFVYVVNSENKVEHRTVTLGDRRGNQRVVLSGIKPNESVVVAGLQLIQPGMTVDPTPQAK
ncbi:Toluene efflux pump periplasmic linker protein TtgD precursor [Rosistilla ulvae]|uniref:Toluene efflux pump periplasmic linker protein TtgD n=1 Tax=Rosistilla ulvae TaxID=1930277 RepID=A0A517LVM8_9BACT|nr:efflux RND transporter periplasmic adaptor subunit [Rosistilla ulvae]QDS86674.1 Toluene efflux pump periplasmic linker protein TtgD precursor [Rosistilla ulvae]